MSARSLVLPDERFAVLRPALEERVRLAARAINAETLAHFLEGSARQTLRQGFDAAGAHEGTLWLADEAREHLVAAHNSGPRAAEMVGCFGQSLRSGMISLVFASEQPICENAVYRNEKQDTALDKKLGVLTVAMLAVPFYFGRELRGVVSCVRLREATSLDADPPPFTPADLQKLQDATAAVTRLIDYRLLAATVGWDES